MNLDEYYQTIIDPIEISYNDADLSDSYFSDDDSDYAPEESSNMLTVSDRWKLLQS